MILGFTASPRSAMVSQHSLFMCLNLVDEKQFQYVTQRMETVGFIASGLEAKVEELTISVNLGMIHHA